MVLKNLNDYWKLLWLEEIPPRNLQSHIARICTVEVSRNVATKEQLMDIAVSNFIKDNKQDFKGLVKIKEKQELIPQTSGLTLVQDWLDNQEFT